MNYNQAKTYARENRKTPTRAEAFFWEKVRNRRFLGLKLNRQYVIKYALQEKDELYFIVDFYCHEKKLIIEIDGEIHQKTKEYDIQRSEILEQLEYSVVRFKNEEILNHWQQTEMKLTELLK